MSSAPYHAHASLDKVPSRDSSGHEKEKTDLRDHEHGHVEHAVRRVDPDTEYDPAFVRKTIRKIDLRLLPILGSLYAFSLIDRTNISLARIIGAGQELQLNTGERYSIIVLVFFIPYILIEWPSNIIIRRVGCALWLGIIATLWGATMLGMGFVKNWQTLAGCRVLLGAFEAGFFPGCVYLITTWYIRREQQTRLAIFYLMSTLVGGFSPIFAYGVSTIGIAYGLYAWRWLFIICGAITCFLGLLAFVLVVDFPDKASFLTPEQIKFVRDRVDYDRGDSVPDALTWPKARSYMSDPKLWGYAFMFMCSTFPSYAYSLFLPLLMGGFGFNTRDSQLLIAPPYAFATVFGIIAAFGADRVRNRGFFIIGQSCVSIIGLCMTAFLTGTYPRYAGTFLGLFGTSANIPAVLAWSQNNVVGQSQRAYASALVISFGGVGGILAGVLFREKDKPKYLPGIWASIVAQIIIIVIAGLMMAWSQYRNKQARTGGKLIQNTPHFFYTL